jgi:hypothetical protein
MMRASSRASADPTAEPAGVPRTPKRATRARTRTDIYTLYGSYASYYTAKARACPRKKGVPFVERLPSPVLLCCVSAITVNSFWLRLFITS